MEHYGGHHAELGYSDYPGAEYPYACGGAAQNDKADKVNAMGWSPCGAPHCSSVGNCSGTGSCVPAAGHDQHDKQFGMGAHDALGCGCDSPGAVRCDKSGVPGPSTGCRPHPAGCGAEMMHDKSDKSDKASQHAMMMMHQGGGHDGDDNQMLMYLVLLAGAAALAYYVLVMRR